MSEWKRLTKEVRFEDLRAEMVEGINNHVERYNLGSILFETLLCVQTDSEKIKESLFGNTDRVYMGVILTPHWLIWAVTEAKTQTTVSSAQLSDIVVQDYVQTQFAKLIPDSGIVVSGRFTDTSENASAFIGLDESETGNKFKELVITSVQNAKK
jgi:hypothetical protein